MRVGDRVHFIGKPEHVGKVVKVYNDRTVDVDFDGNAENRKRVEDVDLILWKKPARGR